MSFAILRTAKLKSAGEIGGSIAHTLRDRDTPNANPGLTPDNEHFGPDSAEATKAGIAARIPEKHRSDAVLCIEYLVTASPEAFTDDKLDAKQYFHDALDWIRERHGADNVISGHLHLDETSPHLVAYVVPLDAATGRLNAKKYLGGKATLKAMQTDFAERVGRSHGLARGLEGSKATHQTVQAFYGALSASQRVPAQVIDPSELKPIKTRSEGLLGALRLQIYVEEPEGIASRLNAKIEPLRVEVEQLRREKRSWLDERKRMAAGIKAMHRELETLEPFRVLQRFAPKLFDKVKAIAVNAIAQAREAFTRKAKEQDRDGPSLSR